MQKLGQMWRELESSKKEQIEKEYQLTMEKFEQEMQEYEKKFGKIVKDKGAKKQKKSKEE